MVREVDVVEHHSQSRYLTNLDEAHLLTREGEIELARQIERGRLELLNALTEHPFD